MMVNHNGTATLSRASRFTDFDSPVYYLALIFRLKIINKACLTVTYILTLDNYIILTIWIYLYKESLSEKYD